MRVKVPTAGLSLIALLTAAVLPSAASGSVNSDADPGTPDIRL